MRSQSGPDVSLTVIALSLMLTACSTLEAGGSKLKSVRTVGIVSAVGNELDATHAGLNGFDNDDQRFSIASWKLDDLIVKLASAEIGNRFEVRPVSYDRAAFDAYPDAESPITLVNMTREDSIKNLLRTKVSPQSLDAYVVIVRAKSAAGSSLRKVEGIGTIRNQMALGSYDQIYALYEVRIYDGRTFELIKRRAAAPLEEGDMTRLAGPSRTVDPSFMPGGGDPVRNEKLRGAIVDMIELSLKRTLTDLYFDTRQ